MRLQKHKSGGVIVGLASVIALLVLWQIWEYFPESEFRLADGSRLPRWVQLPAGIERKHVTVEMSYRSLPHELAARFVVAIEHRTVAVYNGRACPLTDVTKYPGFEEITVDGTTEIIEHKAAEPIFYVTDGAVPLAENDIHQAEASCRHKLQN